MEQLGPLIRVKAVVAREPYEVQITFEDGSRKVIDLAPYLRGPIFQPIRDDRDVFQSVRIVGSTLGWDNGADIDPDVLYYALTPASTDQAEPHR